MSRLCAALVIVAALMVGCSSDEAAEGDAATYGIGTPVTLLRDGWLLTATAAWRHPTVRVPLSGEKQALGVYVSVEVRMENRAKEAQSLGKDRWTLIDGTGRRFPAFVSGGEVGSRINPGLTAPGSLTFDVPPDATALVLTSVGGFRAAIGDAAALPDGPPTAQRSDGGTGVTVVGGPTANRLRARQERQ